MATANILRTADGRYDYRLFIPHDLVSSSPRFLRSTHSRIFSQFPARMRMTLSQRRRQTNTSIKRYRAEIPLVLDR